MSVDVTSGSPSSRYRKYGFVLTLIFSSTHTMLLLCKLVMHIRWLLCPAPDWLLSFCR